MVWQMTQPERSPAVNAAIARAVESAVQIASGQLSAIDGARAIEASFAECYDTYQVGDEMVDAMAVFSGRSDEWEENHERAPTRARIEAEIVEEAHAYLRLAEQASRDKHPS
jgi:hypothetical protein